MRLSLALSVAVSGTLLGCAGTSAPAPDGGLAFGVPSVPAATYVSGDSLKISVESPMGAMVMNMDAAMTLAMSFERVATGVQVTADVEALSGSMNNPMAGNISFDEGDVSGPMVFVVAPTGAVEVTASPTVSGSGAQLGVFAGKAQEFFPRFPDGSVTPGASWTDTVAWSTDEDGAAVSSSTAYTYTMAGDTLVDGTNLLKIAVAGDVDTTINAAQGGMDVEQTLSGTTTGHFLWDVERGLLHSSNLHRDLEGIVNVPGMGIPPMGLKASGPASTRLVN
ncbi:MAG: hypothetical protein ACR2QM_08385 [Longimicrobiales bacterium]